MEQLQFSSDGKTKQGDSQGRPLKVNKVLFHFHICGNQIRKRVLYSWNNVDVAEIF